MSKVRKRNGKIVEFNAEKIEIAILKAVKAVKTDIKESDINAAREIAAVIEEMNEIRKEPFSIDDIQERVVANLHTTPGMSGVAIAYDNYRIGHDEARKEVQVELAEKEKLTHDIKEKLEAKNVMNSNANMDESSFSGRMGEARNAVTKDYAIKNILSTLARKNHEGNRVYTHDLDSFAVGEHNCLSVPFDDLLAKGVMVRTTFLRPAASISTACQLVAVIFQLQSQCQFGGVSATHIDWTMVPYIRKSLFKHYLMEYLKDTEEFFELDLENMDEKEFEEWVDDHKAEYLKRFNLTQDDFYLESEKLEKRYYQRALFETRREVFQGVEALYHNLNSLQSRSGGQLPFTSINYGTCTLPEGRLFIKALLNNSLKGVGVIHDVNGEKQGTTPIFPCGIFQLGKGINRFPGDPNYDLYRLALKSTAKRLYPNYANIDWSGNKGYDINDPKTYFSTMGCRTANGWDANGFGQLKDGRGNICPATIILPTLAMEANGDVEKFMEILDKTIYETKTQLEERFNHICAQSPKSAQFMWENKLMAGYDGKHLLSAMKHGTLAIGQLGLAETLQILIGCDHTTDKGMELAKRIEKLFRDRCAEFKAEEHFDEDGNVYYLNYGVYYTPAESTCFTAMNKFREQYGIIPNVSENDFFTNSMHVPVWKQVSPFEKIDIESQLTGYSSAGCITYVELDAAVANNLDALETIVNYAMDHDIPYFAINVPNDQCLDCGFTGEFDCECPACHSQNIMQLRRVTGYLTGNYKTAFNKGKQAEVSMRYKHSRSIKNMQTFLDSLNIAE